MNDVPELEQCLKLAKERLNRAIAALAPKHKGGEWEEYRAADQEVLLIERRLAASEGEDYAEPFGFPLQWDIGVPMPHLLVNDHRALLAFLIREPDPAWDGSYVTVKSPADAQPGPLALVEFERCISARLGAPNDEVFDGHPLSGMGLETYRAQRVVNSRWLKEIEAINSVHRMFNPDSWHDLQHFIFWFHDSTFECLARSYKVESHRVSMRELLGLMVERLIA